MTRMAETNWPRHRLGKDDPKGAAGPPASVVGSFVAKPLEFFLEFQPIAFAVVKFGVFPTRMRCKRKAHDTL